MKKQKQEKLQENYAISNKEYPNLSGVLKVNPTLGENVGCE